MKRIVGGFGCRALLHWLVVLGIALPAFGCASSEEKLLDQLRSNPLEASDAVAWFDSLPLKEKREWAAKLGHIVLDDPVRPEFVVAFGADREPYPWAFVVDEEGLRLSGNNSFK